MPMFKKTAVPYNTSDVLTIIGPEAIFHGSMTVRGSLRVEGEIEGNITDAQEVVVGNTGKVRGNIAAEKVAVGGQVTGDVVCSTHLEIKNGGSIVGNIRSPKLAIEDGAVFDGNCTMAEAAQAVAG